MYVRVRVYTVYYCIPHVSVVWNIKCQEQRFVELSPSDNWGGAGLLGVTIRLDNYGGADERLIRVLTVQDNSPASIAGLVPLKDYLLGTTVTAFGSTQALASVLQYHVDQVVEIYAYNSDSDVVRVVALMPTHSWGGKGLLGAEVGTGYLHRLPNSSRTTVGQSVERKVRWMGGNTASPHDDNDEDHDGENKDHDDEQPLEMEPHLEMEVDQEDNNDGQQQQKQRRRPEEATKQPYELGKQQDGTKKKQHGNKNIPTKEKKPEPTKQKNDETVVQAPEPNKEPTTTEQQPPTPAHKEPEPATATAAATGDSTKESSSATTAASTYGITTKNSENGCSAAKCRIVTSQIGADIISTVSHGGVVPARLVATKFVQICICRRGRSSFFGSATRGVSSADTRSKSPPSSSSLWCQPFVHAHHPKCISKTTFYFLQNLSND